MSMFAPSFPAFGAPAAPDAGNGIYLADEVLIRAPQLLVPKRHPIGPVRIDWRHPFTKAIVGAWPLFYGTRNFIPDLSGNGKHAVSNGPDITRKQDIYGTALANFANASNDEMNLGTINGANDPLGCNRLDEISIFAFGQLPTDQDNTFPRLVSKESAGAGAGGYNFSMRTASATAPNNTLQCSIGGTNYTPGDNALGSTFGDYSGQWGGMGVTAVTGALDFFWRGENVGTDSSTYASIPASNQQMGILGATYASDRNWNAAAQFIVIWDEKIPDKWMKSLCHDPYQFLLPL